MKKDIRAYTYEQLAAEMEQIGEKKFRAKQIYEWLHVKLADSFEEMTNLSKALREKLEAEYEILPVKMLERQISKIDATNKFLFQLSDGNVVESVLMRYKHGNSVCISSQVGCRMGCRFCASTIGGLERNLSPSEMLGQIYQIQKITGERVSNVVVMGTGEPMDNYENFLTFVRMLTDEHGLHISQRNLTVSTCGIVPKIRELAMEHLQITLALSLHGSTQEKRKQLMPVANKYDLQEVLKACDFYFQETGRRVTFEYSLVHGVNERIQTFSITDVGMVRQVNQDYVYMTDNSLGPLPNLFVVADGMGGHQAGDYASKYTVEVLKRELENTSEQDVERALVSAIKTANREIIKKASEDPHLKGMGTTVVLATIVNQMMYFANVGDSRLYLINQGIVQLTKDHSLVEEMVRLGGIKPEEAKHHPDKNIITRAIGAKDSVEVDFYEHRLKKGDIILMCTDGLSNMVEDEELFHIVQGGRDIVESAQSLVETAKENGGTDNIGIVLVEPFADEVSIC